MAKYLYRRRIVEQFIEVWPLPSGEIWQSLWNDDPGATQTEFARLIVVVW